MGTQSYRSGHAIYYMVTTLVSQNQAGNYSTLNIHMYAQADSGWSGNASGIGFSCTGYGNGTFGFNGSSIEIINFNFNVGHDANGYCNYTVSSHTNATGTGTFAGPTDMIESGSLPRIPKVPGAITVSAGAPAGRNIPVTVSYPSGYDDGGSNNDFVETVWSKDGAAYTGTVNGAWGTRTYTNLAPGEYRFAARAHNGVGYGPYAYSNYVRIVAGGKRAAAAAPMAGSNGVDLSIMRRWSGTAWTDIASVKRATAAGSSSWLELVGPDGSVSGG